MTESNPAMVLWCALCNSRPADGVLQVMMGDDTFPTSLQVCELCVIDIPDNAWMTPDNIKPDQVSMDTFLKQR